MNFDGAFIKEQGIEFAIFSTTIDILKDQEKANKLIKYCEERVFPGYRVVLMAQDSQGKPHYFGKKDLITILENIKFDKIHFRRYTIS